jgi:hypothetical protein
MPSANYSETVSLSADTQALFVFIDTVAMVGAMDDADRKQPEGVNSDPLSQLDWIESELKTSRAAWKFVVGHYPVYSVAEHGFLS